MGIVFVWALGVRTWVSFPGMGWEIPRIRLPLSVWSYRDCSGSVMALVGVFSMVMGQVTQRTTSPNGAELLF